MAIVVLGRLVAPFGIKGWFKLHAYGDDPGSWAEMPRWWVAPAPDAPLESWQTLTLAELRQHCRGLIVKFYEVDDRSAAESYQGWYVGAPREALPEPEKDEYYWGDLIGVEVYTTGGAPLGRVAELITTGANDVLSVRDDVRDRTHLIPFVRAYVLDVDLPQHRITVDWDPDW